MKALSYLFMFTGTVLLIITVLRIFGFMDTVIDTDKSFILILLSGMLLSCIGFLLDTCMIVPMSRYQTDHKKSQVWNMVRAIICCIIMIVAVCIGL